MTFYNSVFSHINQKTPHPPHSVAVCYLTMSTSKTFASIDSAFSAQQRKVFYKENLTTDAFDQVIEATSPMPADEVSILIEDFFRALKKSWVTADNEKREILRSILKTVLAGQVVCQAQAKRLLLAFTRIDPQEVSSDESDSSVTPSTTVKMGRIPRKERSQSQERKNDMLTTKNSLFSK